MVTPIGYGDVSIIFSMVGDAEEMVVTLGITADIQGFGPDDFCNNVMQSWITNLLPSMSDDLTLLRVEGRFGNDGPDLVGVSTLTPAAGGVANDFPPQNVACLVKKRTPFGGRHNRGRMFVPYIVQETAVNNVGVINAGGVTALQAAFTAFREDVEAPPALWPAADIVILHRNDPLLTPTVVTSLEVDPVVATQRRRLRR